jgi:hypothetical protein
MDVSTLLDLALSLLGLATTPSDTDRAQRPIGG